jgi:hypothetical protein
MRNAYKSLILKPEGKIPLGRPRRSWEDNIKMSRREMGFKDVDWIHVAQDTISFSRRTVIHGVSLLCS